tara:strand:- start:3935 stop:5548 length:1614 start_codon:yes stop_codon:yes gene_type:complete
MAGSGTKLWATGDTVTATDFQTYVQDQVVGVYADTSARDAAYGGSGEPTLAEGAVAFIKDVNQIHAYSSAWVPLLDLDTWASDASGNYTIKGDLTVGVDGTGHDVKLFGTTSGVYSLWDQSADEWTFVGADLDMDDNAVIRLGTGDDLLVYASGANSFVDHNGDGDLWIRNLGSGEDLYLQSVDTLNLQTGGANTRLSIDSSGVVSIGGNIDLTDSSVIKFGTGDDLQIYSNGSNSFIDHSGDGDLWIRTLGTGEDLYLNAKDTVSVQLDGNTKMHFYNNDTDVANIGINTTRGTEDTGQYGIVLFPRGEIMYSNTNGQDQIFLTSNGSVKATGGWVYINDGPAGLCGVDDGKMHFYSATSGSAAGAITWVNRLQVANDGLLTSPRSYSATTGNAANLYVDTDGSFYRSTSAARFKTDVEDIVDAFADKVMDLRPVWYRSLATADRRDWSHWGLIAEEVAAIDPRLVQYGQVPLLDEDGEQRATGDPFDGTHALLWETDSDGDPVLRPDGVQYDRIVPLLINLIKRQDARITALEAA